MQILMLGWELPPHNSGGLGVACYYMSKALAQCGARIDFVVPYSAKHDIEFMEVHAASNLNPLHKNGAGSYNSFCQCDNEEGCNHEDLQTMRGVQKQYQKFVKNLIKTKNPSVVHAHDWLTMEAGMMVKKETGAPLIVHVHATEFDRSGEMYGNPLVHEIEQAGLLMADKIIAVSQITKQLIVDRYHIPADKVEVVHNALDATALGYHEYDHMTYKYLEDLKQEGFTVVSTIGRLTVQKGITYFIKAAAKASEKHDKLLFLIAGDGELRDELLELSADLGISDKVFFTGFIRGQAWRDAYTVADIFVMSSISEPFGLTALEAAAHSNAILLSKQSGVGEVLYSTMRFDYWDTDKLADEIVGIALSSALRENLKANAMNEYGQISWLDAAKKIQRIYHQFHGVGVV